MSSNEQRAELLPLKRIRLWYAILILVIAVFSVRLFYLQIIRYDHYKNAALSDQLRQYEIPANRGIISAYDGGSPVPIVLNQTLYTVFADPAFVKEPETVAKTLSTMFGESERYYLERVTREGSRYVVIAKKVDKSTKEKLLGYDYPGIGAQEQSYRVYPQGSLAAQVLGFVNADGDGVYGIEQALNTKLAGQPGLLKAITDVHGVPLAANQDNVSQPAQNGSNVQLTLDLGMQKQMENILKSQYRKTKSQGLSAIIMDPNTGQIKAMANYPTYNPAKSGDVSNVSVFQNNAVSNAIEPGSTMKPLTAIAALDLGAVTPQTSFYDPAKWLIDGYTITNIEEDGGARQQSVESTLTLSLNTGATWLLMRMGGSDNKVTSSGIQAWRDYLVKHFRFGKYTNIEQGYESAGYVPPTNVAASALTFANTSFGQGIQVTALQMATALSSVLNGGTYYQPTLVSSIADPAGNRTKNKPKVVDTGVVNSQTAREIVPLMEKVVKRYRSVGFSYLDFPDNYSVGGKTGTAQVAKPGGGYSETDFNGTYMGFVGGDKPQYVIVVYNIKPKVSGYAGSNAGQPVFADLAHMLINNGYATPKQ